MTPARAMPPTAGGADATASRATGSDDTGSVTARRVAPEDAAEGPANTQALWTGDTGRLAENARRVLVGLIKGPYVAIERDGRLWSALLADEAEIRSRLHDLFLDLVLDREAGFAFVRNVRTDELAIPSTVRSTTLTFMDTAMLLVLREMLVSAAGEDRVIVGRDEVFERLAVYRTADRDESDFGKRMNASWQKMRNNLRVIHSAGRVADDEDRVEISPVLRLIVDADQVRAIGEEYARIAAGAAPTPDPSLGDADGEPDHGSDGDAPGEEPLS